MVSMAVADRPHATGALAAAAVRLVQFAVRGMEFVLPLDRVMEVVALTAVPAAPPMGWIGTLVRGERPVPVADLAFLLGLSATTARGSDSRAILLRDGAERLSRFGVTADAVPTVLLAAREEFQPLPAAAGDVWRTFVAAVLVREESLLLALDVDAMIAALQHGVRQTKSGRITELRALPRRRVAEAEPSRPRAPGGPRTPPAWPLSALALTPLERVGGAPAAVPVVPLDWVREVLPWRRLHGVPHAPAALPGLLTWRGSCLAVLDLARRLTGVPGGDAGRLVIVAPPGRAPLGALAVPGVRGLVTLAAPERELPPPAALDPALVAACLQRDGERLAVLDAAALFA